MTAITTAEAARTLHVTARTVATWCRTGALTAVKHAGRWAIRASAIARLICPASDRPRPGQRTPQLSERAARRRAARTDARHVAAEHGTRVIGHHERARIAAANCGRILARDYLTGLGVDDEFIARYESAFGRKVAQAYRETHHAEPEHGGIVILRGRLWRTMRYVDIADLDAGARAYPRTRHLVPAAALDLAA